MQAVALRFLDDVEMATELRSNCVEMCKMFHLSTSELSTRYRNELERYNYVTPTSYLELISTFKTMLDKKRKCAFMRSFFLSWADCNFAQRLLVYSWPGLCCAV